ncbi:MAG: hypothetical protein ACYC2O_11500 [Microthrixaceae bacterium]
MSTLTHLTVSTVKRSARRTERLASQVRTGWLLAYSDVRRRS